MAAPGGVPERPKGTGCKPVGSAYGGSNPPAPTRVEDSKTFSRSLRRFGGRVVATLGNAPGKPANTLHRGPAVEFPEVDLRGCDAAVAE